MPNGIFPIPAFRTTETAVLRWGLRTRLATRVRRNRLDEQLAAGVKPSTLTPLGLRVRAASLARRPHGSSPTRWWRPSARPAGVSR